MTPYTNSFMRNSFIKTICFIFVFLISTACSTKKNTWLSRNYHSMTTKFNVAFNGNESYKDGLKNIIAANEDDYSTILPLFPISKHSNASAATSDMDRAIEKSRKAIKLHSIKKKPKKNANKRSDEEYQAYYNQNEFNEALKDAWLLIGKAEFHKGDFLGAVGTFSYLTRHYATDKNMVARAQLWMVRAYVEMDWLYEAEQLLQQVDQDALKSSNLSLFASANAVLLLKRDQYKEAIPFVELMLSKEKDKAMKQRFTYVLAQLYEITGNKKSATEAYSSVIKMNPPYTMDFNARISRAQLSSGSNMEKVLKDLDKMTRNPNNKDYLDQLYYAIGNTYLYNGDTLKAIENYNLSVANSTRNGIDKAVTLITLGDLYYNDRKYVEAQPPYDEASKIITNEHDDYARVSKLAEVLGELASQYEIVVWQDTLQYWRTLSKSEQMKSVNRVIEEILEKERIEEERQQQLAQQQQNQSSRFVPTPIASNTGKWYFYNPNSIKAGKSDFQKKWGNRKLEDNWRRSNKASSMFADGSLWDSTSDADTTALQDNNAAGASGNSASSIVDEKNPEYYLRQIPLTSEQLKQSNALTADALFNMAMIYKDKLNEYPLAIETYEEFIRRFSQDPRAADAYFQLYLIESKRENIVAANEYRMKIISLYPDTRYAQALSQPDYVERFMQMQNEQDSLYNVAYQAYSKNNFPVVINSTEYAKKNFPSSPLIPKFMFLGALSTGKTDTPENFELALNQLVEEYPQSDVSAMAKDIIALIRQGRVAQIGTSHGTLLARREEELKESLEEELSVTNTYSAEKQGKHRLMLISSAEQQDMYQFMYQVAAFNFTRFMIKEFDLALGNFGVNELMLSVTNFESYDEVLWYVNSINTDLTLSQMIKQLDVQEVIISEENFALLRVLGLDEYLVFQEKHLGGLAPKSQATNIQPKQVEESEQPYPASTSSASNASDQVTQLPPIAKKVKPTTMSTQQEAALTTEKTESGLGVEKQVSEVDIEDLGIVSPQIQMTEGLKEENLELYKGLYAYQPGKEHVVGIYVLTGKFNFDKFKTDVDAYNAQNYSMLNLQLSIQNKGNQHLIIIGNFSDANIAKSYLLRIVNEKALFEGLRGSNYRNILGTQHNLNLMLEKNDFKTYLTFMQEYYLK